MLALRFGDITFISVLGVLAGSMLINDLGGTLKPYEIRELHAMWDDVLGDSAAAAELRNSAPRLAWTAPSLDQSRFQAPSAPLAEAIPVEDSVLLGEPVQNSRDADLVAHVVDVDFKVPLDCEATKFPCATAADPPPPKVDEPIPGPP